MCVCAPYHPFETHTNNNHMDPKKSNKIREIVRLQQILKKWKKLANNANAAPKNTTKSSNSGSSSTTCSTSINVNGNGSKSIKFLKKTLSFSDMSSAADVVPKEFLAVCVGKEQKRFIIPTEYLGHQAFGMLLTEAEEEFGFQQEGVLKIPCEVPFFEKILKMVEEKRDHVFYLHHHHHFGDELSTKCWSPDCELTTSHHPQMCR